jgi:hypothetical protein
VSGLCLPCKEGINKKNMSKRTDDFAKIKWTFGASCKIELTNGAVHETIAENEVENRLKVNIK